MIICEQPQKPQVSELIIEKVKDFSKSIASAGSQSNTVQFQINQHNNAINTIRNTPASLGTIYSGTINS
jgi:hypothetical protein